MSTPGSKDHPSAGNAGFKLQAGIVVVAAIVAGAIVLSGKQVAEDHAGSGQKNQGKRSSADTKADNSKSFDMLAYLDEHVGVRESEKDVRCWSSFTDLQIFITQCKISPEAKGARTGQHAALIQSIWEAAKSTDGGDEYIDEPNVAKILEEKFPSMDTSEGVEVDLGNGRKPVQVLAQDIRDYEQTIEPWRLLQNWASRHVDEQGRLKLRPQFNEAALQRMYRFLRTFDLAILKEAGRVAKERRLPEIDADSVNAAFGAAGLKPD